MGVLAGAAQPYGSEESAGSAKWSESRVGPVGGYGSRAWIEPRYHNEAGKQQIKLLLPPFY